MIRDLERSTDADLEAETPAEELERTRQLVRLEAVIARGGKAVLEMGAALRSIRDDRLFRRSGYSSFDVYCRDRWDMRRETADRMIRTAEVAGMLTDAGAELPRSEYALRMLTPLAGNPKEMVAIYNYAVSEVGVVKVTGALIADIIRTERHKPSVESKVVTTKPISRTPRMHEITEPDSRRIVVSSTTADEKKVAQLLDLFSRVTTMSRLTQAQLSAKYAEAGTDTDAVAKLKAAMEMALVALEQASISVEAWGSERP